MESRYHDTEPARSRRRPSTNPRPRPPIRRRADAVANLLRRIELLQQAKAILLCKIRRLRKQAAA